MAMRCSLCLDPIAVGSAIRIVEPGVKTETGFSRNDLASPALVHDSCWGNVALYVREQEMPSPQ